MKKLFFILFIFNAAYLFSQVKTDSIIPKWKVKGKFIFLFNPSSFSNWVAGGDNTIAGNIGINYYFNYKNKLGIGIIK